MKRIKKLQKMLSEFGVDYLIITHPIDLFYLLGLSLSAGTLLVSKKEARLFVDGRYLEKCTHALNIAVEKLASGYLKGIAKRKKVGFAADTTTYAEYLKFTEALPHEKLVPLYQPIEKLRVIKDASEIKAIEKACKLLLRGYDFLKTKLRVGITEKELAKSLELFWISEGADRVAFDPIIAFGANSSMPHYRAEATKLKKGDAILVDIGVVVDGYASDMTRMLFFGNMHPKMKEIYQIVHKAQKAAIDRARPGVTSQELYDTAMRVIDKAGYRDAFLHSLGHGIGLEVHEYPTLRRDPTPCILQPNMVVTIEPGIYLPGLGGVRLEEMILITKSGHKILTK